MTNMMAAHLVPFVTKVCGITTEEDAAVAVAAGANALGFNFYPGSPRFVSVDQAKAIAVSLPSSVLRVGVFVNETPRVLARIAAEVGLDIVQVHGVLSGTLPGLRVWRAVPVDASFSTVSVEAIVAEALLLDTPNGNYGGSGQTFEWSLARSLRRRILIAGGLDAGNVAAAIQAARPWGVDACSRLESSPGRKDPEKVRHFVHAAKAAWQTFETALE
jgi:phosphoribosylanthranilate isomerase